MWTGEEARNLDILNCRKATFGPSLVQPSVFHQGNPSIWYSYLKFSENIKVIL